MSNETDETNETIGMDDTQPRTPDHLETPQSPTATTPARRRLWRRLLRRDAGFGVLVLAALLVTVLVISRPPAPSVTRQKPYCATTTVSLSARSGDTVYPASIPQSGAVARPANARVIPMANAEAGLMQPAVDADGNIWVGEMTANKLARINPQTGQILECTPPNGQYNIMATAIDHQGNVWFTEQAANYIGRFDPSSETFKVYALDTAIGPRMSPQDLAFDATGKLWFTLLGGRIGRLDPATGAIQSWKAPLPKGTDRSYPFSLAVTPGGIWFGYLSGGAVGRLDPATGAVTLFPLERPQAAVYAMAADASERIWFTEMQPAMLGSIDPKTGKVTERPVPALASDPSMLYGVATTADGSVWFASAGANSVVRYQAGKDLFTFYRLPASQSIPFGLALGRDGGIWISGDGATDNYVAQITP